MAKRITRGALFGALLCLVCPLCIWIGPIPIGLSLLAVMLAALLLPWQEALSCVAVYLALGCLGLPVFAGFQGGPGVLIGATGGFIISYPAVVLCIGACKKKGNGRTYMGCAFGLLISYACGLLWYCCVAAPASLGTAVMTCILPFVPFDILKIILAVFLTKLIRARM